MVINLGMNLVRILSRQFCKQSSSSMEIKKSVKEIKIPVPWGYIAAQQWGDDSLAPVICIHGYADSSAAFTPLIQQLPANFKYIAIDLPGHGRSSHIPHGHIYSSELYVYTVDKIRRFIGLDKVGLMGHSMGAVVMWTYLYNLLDRTALAIALDNVTPAANSTQVRLAGLERRINKIIGQESKKKTPMTKEQMVTTTERGFYGLLNRPAVELLVERNSIEVEDGFYTWRADRKVVNNQLLGDIANQYKTLIPQYQDCSTCMIQFSPGMRFQKITNHLKTFDAILKCLGSVEYHVINGGHSEHFNSPHRVAPVIGEFLTKNAHKLQK